MRLLWLLCAILGHHQLHTTQTIAQEARYSPLGTCQPPLTRSRTPCPDPSRNGIMGRNVSMVLHMWQAERQESPALWTMPSRKETRVPALPRSGCVIRLGISLASAAILLEPTAMGITREAMEAFTLSIKAPRLSQAAAPSSKAETAQGPKQPTPEPDWKAFQQAGQPTPQPAPVDPQIQALLATLAKQKDLSPEVQVALAEVQSNSNKLATKHIHGAVSKLGSAQKGLDSAVLARQNLHANGEHA